MENITKYTIVVEYHPDELIKKVNSLIDMGWEPHGNLVYASNYLYQPMVKRGEK